MNYSSTNEDLKELLTDLIEVVEEIEKRTVEKCENFDVTPIKKKITDIKYQINRI